MSALVGTGGLIRLILRRDRFLMPIWVVFVGLLPALYVSATDGLYPNGDGLHEYYTGIVANPSMMSMIGPAYADNLGALATWRAGILPVFLGIFSLLTVIRHTRTEEDAGRRELLGSTVVSRQAPLLAALAVTCGANLIVAAIIAGGTAAYGVPVAGSVALGLSVAATGWVFAAVGAVAAQLTEGAGGARAIALAVLGVAYMARAAGDSGGIGGDMEWLSWLSPIGWAHRVRPFADEQWWVFGLLAGLFVVLAVAAAALLTRRDLGVGVLPPRYGRAAAKASFGTPFALAWRLHRGTLLAWSVGLGAFGLGFGGATSGVDQMMDSSEQLATMVNRLGGAAALRDVFIQVIMGMFALIISGYAIQAGLRLRTEESALRAEPVLAAAVGRHRWLASHLVFALAGPAVVLCAFGLGIGLAAGAAAGDVAGELPRIMGAALVQLPAVWILSGVTVALFGVLPRLAAGVAWTALAVCFFVSFLGPLLQLDQAVLDISPFTHIPKLPGGDVTATPLLSLLAITAILVLVGFGGFRRRDIG